MYIYCTLLDINIGPGHIELPHALTEKNTASTQRAMRLQWPPPTPSNAVPERLRAGNSPRHSYIRVFRVCCLLLSTGELAKELAGEWNLPVESLSCLGLPPRSALSFLPAPRCVLYKGTSYSRARYTDFFSVSFTSLHPSDAAVVWATREAHLAKGTQKGSLTHWLLKEVLSFHPSRRPSYSPVARI